MLAIASLLDEATDQQTRDLWRLLEEKCDLSGIKKAPYPHFSWLSCEDLAWSPVNAKLKRFTVKLNTLRVKTAGLGIFSGKIPILYLAIVKTQQLMDIHQMLWKKVGPHLINPQAYYLPDMWMPHITIAHGDLDADNLSCAIRNLAFDLIAFDIHINNISVIFHNTEDVGVKATYKLEQ
jgi:2'-5' RNA ligase